MIEENEKHYDVTLLFKDSFVVRVKAKNEEEAEEEALREMEAGNSVRAKTLYFDNIIIPVDSIGGKRE